MDAVAYRGKGTSPHTRGKPTAAPKTNLTWRNIPAYAGKTHFCVSCAPGSPEHPRIRGENITGAHSITVGVGTSPHTRGKRRQCRWRYYPMRNIPAYAGKTSSSRACPENGQEHPRIRGENGTMVWCFIWFSGTSPHTRGKHTLSSFCISTSAEHPRIRGENGQGFEFHQVLSGTSPHTRGKLLNFIRGFPFCRNIPAYAGKTRCRWCADVRCGEHPRIRGENTPMSCYMKTVSGTSPHTRGKRAEFREDIEQFRNIPAYAGKTKRFSVPKTRNAEHPRIRGENYHTPCL